MPTSPRPSSPEPPRFAARAPDVSVEPVESQAGRDEFIRFQLEHYADDENFVPPIVAERRDFLDPAVNPFFEHARAAYFLARRGGKVVGRIAACVDSRYNRFHDTLDGFVGLFESHNDPGLAAALFEAALGWLKQQGMKRAVGPANLAFHHDCGVLIDGFERPPSMMMPYNPRFYGRLFEANGFVKMRDLASYELLASQGLPEKVVRLADRCRRSGVVRVRRLDTTSPEEDVRRIKAIYETMLKPGFGFAPLTDAEFDQLVHRLRPIILLRPELSLIAEADGEAVAFSITLPDTNIAQKAAGGYLFPFGLAKMLWAARNIDRLRGLLFGIKAGWRRRGIDALLADVTFKEAVKLGYTSGELGWVVEDDRLMNRTIQATGARRIKTYRVYERPL
ncbi:MAG: GNAT family N-acetyltransferase [Myxococcota bacterium]